ncbi:hypothetical protein G7Y89_g6969 [Cudoniella acicularis]|uniref:DEAD/DEAH-box helicase domain-containing protein n=1 Tax=Cudoniella acicularis TaxID=354080 RepID=A0A8H4RK90_9HELO|nr:hypothetical protein G7Y89_g6969 [Cudoniella acicularis]
MDSANVSGIRHKTSVDVARTAYTTVHKVSHLGQKRTFDTFNKGQQGNQTRPENVALADITNKTEFRRPSLHIKCFEPLKASEIIDLNDRGPSEYSQRRGLALTPNPTSNPVLDLSHPSYGLPEQFVNNLASVGVKSIYPWQSDCLLRSGALGGERNLVYTAPTGGGKSLVADILMLKKIIEDPGRKAILVLPYVALVQEKLRWLRKIVEGLRKPVFDDAQDEQTSVWRKRGDEDLVRVVGFFGGSKAKATWDDLDIAVCTIEKVGDPSLPLKRLFQLTCDRQILWSM